MNNTKVPLADLIESMSPDQAKVCNAIYIDYKGIIDTIPGSSTKHQAWEGGYTAHLEEAMNLAIIFYKAMNARRELNFELSDVLFCLFLHDFDKVQRYEKQGDRFVAKASYNSSYIDKTVSLLRDNYGYTLTDEQYNALKYAHGEGDDYHPTDRIMLPLATLVHCCDVISARIWYDDGRSHTTWD